MNIAMIGTGSFAQMHLGVLRSEEDIKVVGHVGTSLEKAQVAASTFGGRAYTSTAELLKNETIQAVWISVPPFAHGQIEHLLIEAGIPFLVEKPLAADFATAEEIAKAIATTKLITAVGYHWRALDFLPQLKEILREKEARLMVASWHGSTPGVYWWSKQALSGGQVVEQATHLLDLARYLLGEAKVVGSLGSRKPKPARPEHDVAEVTGALLRFSGGTIGTLTTTSLLKEPELVQLQLVFKELSVTIEQEQLTINDGKELKVITRTQNPYKIENHLFLEAVRQNDPSLVLSDYADALETHRLCWDVLRQSQN